MKLTKGELQGAMTTETLDARMFVRIHGPRLDDDDAVKRLCTTVSRRFWALKKRVPGRAAGGIAAAKAKVKNHAKKRKADAEELATKTTDANAAIASTGPATVTRPTFESQHGEGYVMLERPKIDTIAKEDRIAKIDDDGKWSLGRIKKVIVKTASTKRLRFTWKASSGSVEYPKLRLSKRTYGTEWALFAPRKKQRRL